MSRLSLKKIFFWGGEFGIIKKNWNSRTAKKRISILLIHACSHPSILSVDRIELRKMYRNPVLEDYGHWPAKENKETNWKFFSKIREPLLEATWDVRILRASVLRILRRLKQKSYIPKLSHAINDEILQNR